MTRLRFAASAACALFLLFGCGGSTAPNATPQISGLFPSEITAGSQAFTLFVGGTQFISTSTAQWNGSDRPATFNAASTQLAVSITATDVQNPGIASVTVTNPAPGGGVSIAISFTINPVHDGSPTITSISPMSAPLNGPAFTLTVNGTNFVQSDFVTWNGGLRKTTFSSATQLTADISATDLTQQMTAGVAVHTTQLGVASPSVSFEVGSSTSSAVMPEIISVNAVGGNADGPSSSPAVSADGRLVAFYSEAKNLVSFGSSGGSADGPTGNIFVRDTCLGVGGCSPHTAAVDLAPDGGPPNSVAEHVAISADGRYVAFASRATNLVSDSSAGAPAMWRTFVRDICVGASAPQNCSQHTELVSSDPTGQAVAADEFAMSADGRFVAFQSAIDGAVFLRDTCHGAAISAGCAPSTVLASVGTAWRAGTKATPGLATPRLAISPDGRYVAFAARPVSPGSKQAGMQIFLRDTCASAPQTEACAPSTMLVSAAVDGAFGNRESQSPSVSADGRFVVFQSAASNLTVDSAAREDVYLRDTCLGPTATLGCTSSTKRISADAPFAGALGNFAPSISSSGRYISYAAQTSRDSTAASSGSGSLIVYDTCFGAAAACSAGALEVLTPDGSAIPLIFGNADHEPIPVTPDGRFVVFPTSQALSASRASGVSDVYLTSTPFPRQP